MRLTYNKMTVGMIIRTRMTHKIIHKTCLRIIYFEFTIIRPCIRFFVDSLPKQGFIWVFEAHVDGKKKTIKQSVNKEWLIEFATKWKEENDYNF